METGRKYNVEISQKDLAAAVSLMLLDTFSHVEELTNTGCASPASQIEAELKWGLGEYPFREISEKIYLGGRLLSAS